MWSQGSFGSCKHRSGRVRAGVWESTATTWRNGNSSPVARCPGSRLARATAETKRHWGFVSVEKGVAFGRDSGSTAVRCDSARQAEMGKHDGAAGMISNGEVG
jgi:hypothetical protein